RWDGPRGGLDGDSGQRFLGCWDGLPNEVVVVLRVGDALKTVGGPGRPGRLAEDQHVEPLPRSQEELWLAGYLPDGQSVLGDDRELVLLKLKHVKHVRAEVCQSPELVLVRLHRELRLVLPVEQPSGR